MTAVQERPPLSADSLAPSETLACALSEYAKLISLLPSSNERVQKSARSVIDELARAFVDRPSVALSIEQGRVMVGDETVGTDYNRNLRWFVDRLDRTGVASIEFLPAVSLESLTAFSRRLVANGINRGSHVLFEDLWPDRYDGIDLHERRYDGAFPVGHNGSATRWKTASRQGQMLAELLESNPRLTQRIVRLQAVLDQSVAGDDPGAGRKRVDIVGRLVNLLPAEALADSGRLVEMADDLLKRLSAEIDAPRQGSRDTSVNHMLLRLSRKFFYRPEEGAGVSGPSAPIDDPGDEPDDGLDDDPSQAAEDIPVDTDVPEATGAERIADIIEGIGRLGEDFWTAELQNSAPNEQEQLGVLLHFLVRVKDNELAERLRADAVRLLARDPRGGSSLVRSFVEQARARFELIPHTLPLDRLACLMADPRLAPLAADTGLFCAEQIAAAFPAVFLAFLDATDFGDQSRLRHAEEVCRVIGAERLLRSGPVLRNEGGFERNGRADKILSNPRPAFLPLLHLILEGAVSRRVEVAQAVRALELGWPEAGPLAQTDDPLELPVEYLLKLTARSGVAARDAKLRRSAARVLVRLAGDAEKPLEKRVLATGLLGSVRSTEAREALLVFARARRWLVVPRQPAAIRQAARRALARYRE